MSRPEWIYTGQSTIKVKALPFAAANALATPSESSVVPLHVTQLLMDFVTVAVSCEPVALGAVVLVLGTLGLVGLTLGVLVLGTLRLVGLTLGVLGLRTLAGEVLGLGMLGTAMIGSETLAVGFFATAVLGPAALAAAVLDEDAVSELGELEPHPYSETATVARTESSLLFIPHDRPSTNSGNN
jgi:hypothetical protein